MFFIRASIFPLPKSYILTRSMSSLKDIRVPYDYEGNAALNDQNVKTLNPFSLFKQWMEEAVAEKSIKQPNKMVLATCSSLGRPSSRYVLLKEYDQEGYVFYSCLNSKKSKEIQSNPFVALNFYWEFFHRQVRIEGKAVEVTREQTNTYFVSRPKGSQISAAIRDVFSSPSRTFFMGLYK